MPKRLLIAAGESADSPDALPFGVRELIDAADQVLVVTPALPTRFEWLASATDKAREQADERLRAVMEHVEEIGTEVNGTEVSGTVGADDPLLAFEDALAAFDAGHILVALRAPEHADWQERGLLDALLRRFGIPVTVFTLPE
jgi:sugar phosphate isomerase/epimerase